MLKQIIFEMGTLKLLLSQDAQKSKKATHTQKGHKKQFVHDLDHVHKDHKMIG